MDRRVVLFCFLGILIGNISTAYDNVALKKTAWQQHPFPKQPNWGADKAVDGQFTNRTSTGEQCTISDNDKTTATWRVDLGSVLNIHHITIYYRTDEIKLDGLNGYTARFLGFSIYISNTINKDDWTLCFKDTKYTNGTIPNTTTIECLKHGRYVIYYNERIQGSTYPVEYSKYAFNELCELEVYGCNISGVYGENCDSPCPQNCQEGHCNIEDGSCFGCVIGYKGSRCENACVGGKFGLNCTQSCGVCLDKEQCHHINGSCLNGCDRGYRGINCTEECIEGRYSYNCNETCNVNCGVPGRCDRVTGKCQGGCQAGWKGKKCNKKCNEGKFGQNCAQSCGVCLDKEQCHHINGACLNGCDKGYREINCTKECIEGHHSYNCNETCNVNCGVPGRCDRVAGECQGGCQAGWKGKKCDKKCNEGKFGQNCAQSCGVCFDKEQCHHINGTCLNGCDRGYRGINCTEGCAWGFYGYGCNETCKTTCSNRTCDAISGACPQMIGPDLPDIDAAPIIGGVVAVIIVCLAAVVIVIVFRRLKRYKQEHQQHRHTRSQQQRDRENFNLNSHINDNMEMKINPVLKPEKQKPTLKTTNERKYDNRNYDTDDEGIENPYGDLFINEETVQDIPVNQLENVIAEKRKDEEEGFKREFAMLPHGEQHKCDAGKLPENVTKNRYKTTFPYDHSRVILKVTNGNSDYINANFIKGTDSEGEYIASQGPKQNTLSEFWAMTWQKNVTQIVMLTNLKERAKIKCTQYWPEEMKAIAFGNIIVKSTEVKEYAFYIIRKLSVTHKEVN